MTIGVGAYSFTIGGLSSIIKSMNKQATYLTDQLNKFEDISNECLIPDYIKYKVVSVFEQNYKENSFFGFDADNL